MRSESKEPTRSRAIMPSIIPLKRTKIGDDGSPMYDATLAAARARAGKKYIMPK
jgi:hypothetical protein